MDVGREVHVIYGAEKRLEMARSILPSRWRCAKKLKQGIHQAARSRVRTAMQTLQRSELDAVDEPEDLFHEPRAKVASHVWRRRSSDKLNHFIAWAEVITRELPEVSRLSSIRGLLPKNLIGKHAVSHLVRLDHFRTEEERAIRWYRRQPPPPHLPDQEQLRLLALVLAQREALDLLNERLLGAHQTCLWPRNRFCQVVARVHKGRLVPRHLTEWEPQGPLRPPLPTGPTGDDLAGYLRVLKQAALASPLCIGKKAEILIHTPGEIPRDYRGLLGNPWYHPEWQECLDWFLYDYRESGGDPERMRRISHPNFSGCKRVCFWLP